VADNKDSTNANTKNLVFVKALFCSSPHACIPFFIEDAGNKGSANADAKNLFEALLFCDAHQTLIPVVFVIDNGTDVKNFIIVG